MLDITDVKANEAWLRVKYQLWWVRNYPVCFQDPVLQAGANVSNVCVGDEWHRFPSSFHLPDPAYRLVFVKSGFHGLLPRPFATAQVLLANPDPYNQ